MLGINPRIFEHEIKKYENVILVWQKVQPINPCKVDTIKPEVEKLLKYILIYVVHVDKKQGTICVCVDFRDLKKTFPKENYPTLVNNQIINECAKSEIFSFMDGFSSYNHIHIHLEDQHKTLFICPWETFTYRNMYVGLKNIGATF